MISCPLGPNSAFQCIKRYLVVRVPGMRQQKRFLLHQTGQRCSRHRAMIDEFADVVGQPQRLLNTKFLEASRYGPVEPKAAIFGCMRTPSTDTTRRTQLRVGPSGTWIALRTATIDAECRTDERVADVLFMCLEIGRISRSNTTILPMYGLKGWSITAWRVAGAPTSP